MSRISPRRPTRAGALVVAACAAAALVAQATAHAAGGLSTQTFESDAVGAVPAGCATLSGRAPALVSDVRANEMILDIGPKSIEHVVSVLARCKTLVWNGPFGAFEMEPFDTGTVEVAEAAAELTQAGKLVTVAGGGDTVAALNAAGCADRFTYISTAGGAFLEWLEGRELPGVAALALPD